MKASNGSGGRKSFWGGPPSIEAIDLPDIGEDDAWAPRHGADRHRVPAEALPFGTDPIEPRRSRTAPRAPATPPCAALQAVLTCFSLHQRASWGRPLTTDEQRVLERIENALRSADIRSRRRWKRHRTSRPVRIDGSGKGRMVDLSAGGLRIGNASVFPQRGSDIEVSMRVAVDGGERTLVFPSRVTWIDTAAGSFGVAFIAPARWENQNESS
jgi:hypothetical protein